LFYTPGGNRIHIQLLRELYCSRTIDLVFLSVKYIITWGMEKDHAFCWYLWRKSFFQSAAYLPDYHPFLDLLLPAWAHWIDHSTHL